MRDAVEPFFKVFGRDERIDVTWEDNPGMVATLSDTQETVVTVEEDKVEFETIKGGDPLLESTVYLKGQSKYWYVNTLCDTMKNHLEYSLDGRYQKGDPSEVTYSTDESAGESGDE